MKRIARTLIVIIPLVSVGISGPTAIVEAEAIVDPRGIYGSDAELTEIIEYAIERFDEVGLDLPELRIYVHPAKDGCGGATCRYGQHGELDRIDLCSQAKFPYTMLHELAHAWEKHNVPDEVRQDFLAETGLVWYNAQVPWKERGIEAAAEAIAWGLYEKPLTAEQAAGHAERLRHFELLTGIQSPRVG